MLVPFSAASRAEKREHRRQVRALEEHLENRRIEQSIQFTGMAPLVGLADSGHATQILAANKGTAASAIRLIRNRAEELTPELGVYVRRFVDGKFEDKPAFDHPLQRLLHNPTLLDGTHTHTAAQLYGDAYAKVEMLGESYLIILKDGSGIPFNLQMPTPGSLEPFVEGGRITGYRLTSRNSVGMDIAARDVVRIWVPDEENLYTARGIMARASHEINLDAHAVEVWEAFYRNNATPQTVMVTDIPGMNLPSPEKQEELSTALKRSFHRIRGRLSGTMKMIAPGWKLQELKTQSEAQSGVLMMDHTSKQVLEAWGVSPVLIGRTEASNRANAETANFSFDKRVMLPRTNRFSEAFTSQLAGQYPQTADGVQLIVKYADYVARDKAADLAQDESDLKLKVRSINEVRRRRDEESKDVTWGALPVGTMGEVPYTGEEPLDAIDLSEFGLEEEPESADDIEEALEEETTEIAPEEEEEERQLGGHRVLGSVNQMRAHFAKEVEWQRIIQREERWTPRYRSRQSAVFTRQAEVVVKRFLEIASQRFQRGITEEVADLVDEIMPMDGWQKMFERTLAPVRQAAYVESATEALSPISTNQFRFTDRIRSELKRQNLSHYVNVNETTRNALTKALVRSTQEGESVNEAARRISKVFGQRKKDAIRIARTEIGAATQSAQIEGYRQSGVVEQQQWNTSLDSSVRDGHLIEGQIVPLGGQFTLNDAAGSKASAPLDVTLPAGERINCRCFVTPIFIGETGLEVIGG